MLRIWILCALGLRTSLSSCGGGEGLRAYRFVEGHNMQWIDSSRDIVLANDNKDIPSNRDEIRVRNSEMPSISEVQGERPEAILHAFPDFPRLHR